MGDALGVGRVVQGPWQDARRVFEGCWKCVEESSQGERKPSNIPRNPRPNGEDVSTCTDYVGPVVPEL